MGHIVKILIEASEISYYLNGLVQPFVEERHAVCDETRPETHHPVLYTR